MREPAGQAVALEASERWRTARYVGAASRRALHQNPTMLAGLIIIVAVTLFAVSAPVITFHSKSRIDPTIRLQTPSVAHWFGTDHLGRDLWTRVTYGSRISLQVGLFVAVFSAVFGTAVGMISGYYRMLDNPIMRVMDAMLAFPSFLLVIAIVATMQAGIWNVIGALTIVEIPRVARLARSSVLTLRERDFVLASLAIGASNRRIMLLHILPNSLAPIFVQATFVFAVAILIEAGLSFLGTGVPPDIPTWGNVMGEGRQVFVVAPYVLVFPGLFLSFTVLGVNLVGDGLRDVLDPKLRGSR